MQPGANGPMFERPDMRTLAQYTICCALIYPFLYSITLICNGRSLFEVRLMVGLGCAIVSFGVGLYLLEFAERVMAACSESYSSTFRLGLI